VIYNVLIPFICADEVAMRGYKRLDDVTIRVVTCLSLQPQHQTQTCIVRSSAKYLSIFHHEIQMDIEPPQCLVGQRVPVSLGIQKHVINKGHWSVARILLVVIGLVLHSTFRDRTTTVTIP
jgi:hypothetical protein